eukprot:scaffold12782_cov129-Isochrysis_galbana.AAC.3
MSLGDAPGTGAGIVWWAGVGAAASAAALAWDARLGAERGRVGDRKYGEDSAFPRGDASLCETWGDCSGGGTTRREHSAASSGLSSLNKASRTHACAGGSSTKVSSMSSTCSFAGVIGVRTPGLNMPLRLLALPGLHGWQPSSSVRTRLGGRMSCRASVPAAIDDLRRPSGTPSEMRCDRRRRPAARQQHVIGQWFKLRLTTSARGVWICRARKGC